MSLIIDTVDYSLEKTLKCGQVFRYTEHEDGSYTVHSGQRVCNVKQVGHELIIEDKTNGNKDFWITYFNCGVLSPEFLELMSGNSFLQKAYDHSKGLRLLKQDSFECLISFIISQQKRISQIQSAVELLCDICGTQLEDGSKGFPDAKNITRARAPFLKLGYRAPYVVNAAEEVASGSLVLENYTHDKASYSCAMERLMRLQGVGLKVANCVCLFGLGHTEAFPIDTHMDRILKREELKGFNPEDCGDYAGLVQQYLFNYAISNND